MIGTVASGYRSDNDKYFTRENDKNH